LKPLKLFFDKMEFSPATGVNCRVSRFILCLSKHKSSHGLILTCFLTLFLCQVSNVSANENRLIACEVLLGNPLKNTFTGGLRLLDKSAISNMKVDEKERIFLHSQKRVYAATLESPQLIENYLNEVLAVAKTTRPLTFGEKYLRDVVESVSALTGLAHLAFTPKLLLKILKWRDSVNLKDPRASDSSPSQKTPLEPDFKNPLAKEKMMTFISNSKNLELITPAALLAWGLAEFFFDPSLGASKMIAGTLLWASSLYERHYKPNRSAESPLMRSLTESFAGLSLFLGAGISQGLVNIGLVGFSTGGADSQWDSASQLAVINQSLAGLIMLHSGPSRLISHFFETKTSEQVLSSELAKLTQQDQYNLQMEFATTKAKSNRLLVSLGLERLFDEPFGYEEDLDPVNFQLRLFGNQDNLEILFMVRDY